jgi:hypothetical protein
MSGSQCMAAFTAVAATAGQARKRKTRPAPYSIRFTPEERARLDRDAGKKPVSMHIRDKLFGDGVSHRVRRPNRKLHQPSVNQAALARVLAALGQSRLASNLNQIAKAANMGALPVTPDLERDLQEACCEVRSMRADLIAALGLKADPPSSDGLRRGKGAA